MASDQNSRSPFPDAPVSNSEDVGGERIQIGQGVRGRILSSVGRPVSGALIKAKSIDPEGAGIPAIAILSDENGKYVWPLQPGRYELSVAVEGNKSVTKPVEVLSEQITELDFVLND